MSDWMKKQDWHTSRQDTADRLESLKGTDTIVPFCTNKMLDRGTVFHCLINEEGHAIVQRSSKWWSYSFTESTERVGDDLGEVVVSLISGSSYYQLKVGYFSEGQG